MRVRQSNGRCLPSSSLLAMILIVLVIVTSLQVMIIVYSGHFASDKTPTSRTLSYSDVIDRSDKVSKKMVPLVSEKLDMHLNQRSIDNKRSVENDHHTSEKTESDSNQGTDQKLELRSTLLMNTSYYYYYYGSNNQTEVEQQMELTSFPKSADIPYKIVWLMSFPNSGTSYTMQAVRKYTRTGTATNYVEESEDTVPVPVYQNSPTGPYWIHISSSDSSSPPENSYILTKTHCDGYCNANQRCKVSNIHSTIMSLSNFQYGCLGIPTHHHLGPSHTNTTSYSSSLVHKAIHLVRDPLDNIVSRFHLAFKKLSKQDQQLYPRNDIGFQRFCNFWDSWQLSTSTTTKRKKQNQVRKNTSFKIHIPGKQESLLTLADVEDVPCWSDFYRYVSWHNNAFQVQANLHLPSLVVYYEEYEDSWEDNMSRILKFLNQTKGAVKGKKGKVHPFQGGKGYHHYFSEDQQRAVWSLIEKISSPQSWTLLQRYQIT